MRNQFLQADVMALHPYRVKVRLVKTESEFL